MAKQQTLINVQQDALGMEATAYLRMVKEMEELKEKMEAAGRNLIDSMREANRLTIFVEGRRVSVRFIESKEKIKVE
jgi:hypothetical protein